MNETRKEIINLISEYMDKTLSEGCLIKIKKVSEQWYKENDWNYRQISLSTFKFSSIVYSGIGNEHILGLRDNEQLKIELKPTIGLFCEKIKKAINDNKIKTQATLPKDRVIGDILDYEIVGHYDITAVLKYINNNLSILETNLIDDEIIFNGGFYKILNKPLHLYTEEQEEDLLNLLTNLK